MTKTKAGTNSKLMQWRDVGGNLSLFLTTEAGEYVNYVNHPLCQPDYLVPGSNLKLSRGYRTMQVALTKGYEYDQTVDQETADVTNKTTAQRVADSVVSAAAKQTQDT